MVRVDVFEKDNKNYLVPIYVSDFAKMNCQIRQYVQIKMKRMDRDDRKI